MVRLNKREVRVSLNKLGLQVATHPIERFQDLSEIIKRSQGQPVLTTPDLIENWKIWTCTVSQQNALTRMFLSNCFCVLLYINHSISYSRVLFGRTVYESWVGKCIEVTCLMVFEVQIQNFSGGTEVEGIILSYKRQWSGRNSNQASTENKSRAWPLL